MRQPPTNNRKRPSGAEGTKVPAVRAIVGCAAFSFVEMLMVVAMVSLLLAIFIPSLMGIRKRAQMVLSETRVSRLDAAVRKYKEEKGFFPGQRDRRLWNPPAAAPLYTGSQVLAAVLYEYNGYADINTLPPNTPVQDTKYVDIKVNDLICYPLPDENPNSLSDHYDAQPMPVLYFPSRPEATGRVDQYVYDDNLYYYVSGPGPGRNVGPGFASEDAFWDWITDYRVGRGPYPFVRANVHQYVPYNANDFLLIASGLDREYGTQDDITNWSR